MSVVPRRRPLKPLKKKQQPDPAPVEPQEDAAEETENEEMEGLQPAPDKPQKSQKPKKQSQPRQPKDDQRGRGWQEPPPPPTARQRAWNNQNWPAWGHFIAAGIALAVWTAGTAVQVQTSEAWIISALGITVPDALMPHFSVFGQIPQFWTGGLDHRVIVPDMFAWGVQAALILFSIGIDLPAHTRRHLFRARLFACACTVLIAINSVGDWNYSADFGVWGQLGFTTALFVTTFCFGYVAIHEIHCGIRAMWR